MKLVAGTEMCGFTLKRGRYLHEQDATLYEFVHNKTGAELCFMDSDIENKLFYAAFKTVPFDNTGVFHILEHSVLCGSELYPVREPFVELLKSSMQTFLNALTFSDKTVYPCSSRNETDFLNLTKVYLDAVFAPRCVTDENVFLQEGWHWETDETGHRFKGVVFNEMKGAMAGADSVTERSFGHLLFPDTCYGFNSGGDPVSIPDLSIDTFRETYARFYHPSNCRFYLDGSVPIEKTLGLIDSYLSRFDKTSDFPEILLQKPVSKRADVFYAINDAEEEKGKSFFTLGRIFAGWEEKEKVAAMQLLIDVLSDSNSSPLKKAILDKNLGEDVEVNLDTGTAQSVLTVTIRNTDKDKEEDIIKAWDDAVKQIISEGIDRQELEAGLAALEFRFREPTEPRGLYRGITALDSWLYGGDPSLYLTYEDLLQALQDRIDHNGYIELLYELLSDAKGMSRMWTLPSKTKSEEDEKNEQLRLAQMSDKETEEERQARFEKNEALFRWQSTPDTQEQLNTLPNLTLKDIPESLYRFPSETKLTDNYPVISHKTDTGGIVYVYYYFRLTDFSLEELPYINLITSLLTELPTTMHPDIRELQRAIKLLTGNISFNLRTESKDKDVDNCTPYFIAKYSTLSRNIDRSVDLVRDILLTSDFTDTDTIYRVLLQEKESVRQSMIMRGDSAGITMALSSCTARYATSSAYTGFAYLSFLKSFADNFEQMLPELLRIVKKLQEDSFSQKRAILSLTARSIPDPRLFLKEYPVGTPVKDTISPEKKPQNAYGIKIPAPIGFATAAWYSGTDKPAPFGSLSVAAKILSLNALWNRIRVSGGAYGAGFTARRDNCFVCYSYRDPSPKASLKVYEELGDELLTWCKGNEKVDKYIISTISDMEPLISVSAIAGLEDARLLCGYSYEMRVQARLEMLKTDKEAIIKWADTFKRFGKEMNTCLVGSDQLITEKNRILYDL